MATNATGFELDVHELAADDAVSRLIEHAVLHGASDLLLASNENHIAVSMRHLGVQRLVCLVKAELGRACIAHVKAVAGIDFANHRRPLDGHWNRKIESGRRIDLRISVLPTLHGEDMNLRFLNRQTQFLGLDQLGFLDPVFAQLREILQSPSGLILIAGPTGSGKTTTQYALLHHLNNGLRKINTIEDPVEYELEGVRQAQVDYHGKLGFPELLRAVLRQAPDVIMLGEVRDPEVAETAIRAANSGHLVLATLHAPGAAAAILTLKALGVSAHFLGMSLRAVLSQRLIRTLCPQCRVPSEPGRISSADAAFLPSKTEPPIQYFEPSACPQCQYTGYAGQSGIFELMVMNDTLRHLIYEGRSPGEIYREALKLGLHPFRLAAGAKMAEGVTTLAEIRRCLPREFLEG